MEKKATGKRRVEVIDRLNFLTLKALMGLLTREEDQEGTRLVGELTGVKPVHVQD